jgi:ribosomal protein RSM22 (predicted rRNA methylase)
MISYEKLKKCLIYDFKSEDELVAAIHQITEGFTANREELAVYLASEKMVAAYAAFYLSTNIGKFSYALSLLPAEKKNLIGECDFVDIGCGPGTFILSLLALIPEFKHHIYGIDGAPLMLKQANLLIDAFKPHVDNIYLSSNTSLALQSARKKFVLFGHSLNEMGFEKAVQYIQDLKPEYIMFLEPGTKQAFELILQIRSWLIDYHYDCQYPCFANSVCPMKGTENWCHQYFYLNHEQEVARLAQLAQRDRHNLPMTFHFYQKQNKSTALLEGKRIVRSFPANKAGKRWQICTPDERGKLYLQEVETLKRHYSKAEFKHIENLSSGNYLECTGEEKIVGDNLKRLIVKIPPTI